MSKRDGSQPPVASGGYELPPEVNHLAIPQQIAWLDSPKAVALLPRSTRRKIRRRLRVQLELADRVRAAAAMGGSDARKALSAMAAVLENEYREAARGKLRLWCCSSVWADVCYDWLNAGGLVGGVGGFHSRNVRPMLGDAAVYPPAGDHSHMARCAFCDRDVPATAGDLVSLNELAEDEGWDPPDPSGKLFVARCYDCYLARLPVEEMVMLQSSTAIVTIYQIPQNAREVIRQTGTLTELLDLAANDGGM
jgi:hypothetical protein